jgi:hypothetical protein
VTFRPSIETKTMSSKAISATQGGTRLKWAVIGVLMLVALLWAFGIATQRRTTFEPPADIQSAFDSKVAAFTHDSGNPADVALAKNYQQRLIAARELAISNAASRFRMARILKWLGHGLSFLVMLSALTIGLLGAAKGIALSAAPGPDEISRLGRGYGQLRKRVLALAAVSAFLVAAADRVSTISAESELQAQGCLHLVEKADEAALGALEPK